jgi:hypothetical protein
MMSGHLGHVMGIRNLERGANKPNTSILAVALISTMARLTNVRLKGAARGSLPDHPSSPLAKLAAPIRTS